MTFKPTAICLKKLFQKELLAECLPAAPTKQVALILSSDICRMIPAQLIVGWSLTGVCGVGFFPPWSCNSVHSIRVPPYKPDSTKISIYFTNMTIICLPQSAGSKNFSAMWFRIVLLPVRNTEAVYSGYLGVWFTPLLLSQTICT